VVIAGATRARLPEDVRVSPLPPLQVKGKAEPVTAYVLTAIDSASHSAGSTAPNRPG
jgi:class 3 adenylate cyclase